MRIVIDTNIFISAMMKDSLTREIIVNTDHDMIFPEYEFQELYKYKDEIIKRSTLSETEFIKLTSLLLRQMRIISYDEIRNDFDDACNIMDDIDSGDVIFIATALAFDASIWSDDKHFKVQNKIKVFTTQEMISYK